MLMKFLTPPFQKKPNFGLSRSHKIAQDYLGGRQQNLHEHKMKNLTRNFRLATKFYQIEAEKIRTKMTKLYA